MVTFCLQLWKGAQAKTRKLTHDEIKKKLIESLVMNDTIKSNELTKKIQEVKTLKKQQDLYKSAKVLLEQEKKKA